MWKALNELNHESVLNQLSCISADKGLLLELPDVLMKTVHGILSLNDNLPLFQILIGVVVVLLQDILHFP
jgi:hypothetical protein